MKKFKIFILTLIVLLMTSGAYATDLNTKSAVDLNTVNVGDEFNIKFEDNSASTGYEWNLHTFSDGISLVKSTYIPYNEVQHSHMPFMSIDCGLKVFTFKATNSGEKTITFEKVRPWDTANPIDTRTFSINCL